MAFPSRRTAAALAAGSFVLALAAPGAPAGPGIDQAGRLAAPARAGLAREIAADIGRFLDRLGPPPAEEREAVLAEVAAVERLADQRAVDARMRRLYATPAFHHLRLANALAVARDALACAAGERMSLRREMSCWAIAAAYLGDQAQHEEALAVLASSGRLGYDGGMTRGRWLAQAALWARYTHAIHHAITIPFLSASLP